MKTDTAIVNLLVKTLIFRVVREKFLYYTAAIVYHILLLNGWSDPHEI